MTSPCNATTSFYNAVYGYVRKKRKEVNVDITTGYIFNFNKISPQKSSVRLGRGGIELRSGPSNRTKCENSPKDLHFSMRPAPTGADTGSGDIYVIETTFILQEPNLNTTSYHQNAEVT